MERFRAMVRGAVRGGQTCGKPQGGCPTYRGPQRTLFAGVDTRSLCGCSSEARIVFCFVCHFV